MTLNLNTHNIFIPPKYQNLSEDNLTTLYNHKDPDAIAALYKQYADQVYGYLYKKYIDDDRCTLEDIEESVLSAFFHHKKKHTVFTGKNNAQFRSFITQKARNNLIDVFNRKSASTRNFPFADPARFEENDESFDIFNLSVEKPASAEDHAIAQQTADILVDFLEQLSERNRTIVELKFESTPEKEIAKICELPVGTIKRRYFTLVRSFTELSGNLPIEKQSAEFDIRNLLKNCPELGDKKNARELLKPINMLPKALKQILYLQVTRNMSFEDIAEKQKLSVTLCEKQSRLACDQIRKYCEEHNIVPPHFVTDNSESITPQIDYL